MHILQDPDFVASPGTRVVTSWASGDATGIADILIAAGWTLISTGSVGGFPSYKMKSAQPPWWDHDNTPAFYNAGVKVEIKGPVNFGDGPRITFQGMSMDELTVDPFGGDTPYLFTSYGNFRVIANPFGVFVRIPGEFERGRALIMGALHTPRSMQERIGLENVFLIQSGFCFRQSLEESAPGFGYLKDASGERLSRDSRRMVLLVDPTGVSGVSGRKPPAKIYSPDGVSHPFLNPASVGWIGPTGLPFRQKGWFYDAYIAGKGYTEGTVHTFPNGNIAEAWTDNPAETAAPGTLMLMNAGP